MMYSFCPRRTKKIAIIDATIETAPRTNGNSVAIGWSGKIRLPNSIAATAVTA